MAPEVPITPQGPEMELILTTNSNRIIPSLDTAEMVSLFMAPKVAKGLAKATLSSYGYRLGEFAKAYPRLSMEPSEIESFIDHPEWSTNSRETAYRLIRGFYLWLLKRRHLHPDMNPVDLVEAPRLERKIPRILSPQQLRRVVEVSKAPHEWALILTLMDTGCRIGELAGRTKADIVGNALRVSGKTGGRMVPLRPEARAYLEQLPTSNLFPRRERIALGRGGLSKPPVVDEPAAVDTLETRAKQVLRRARIRPPKLGPHLLRHSVATIYIDNGGDVVRRSCPS